MVSELALPPTRDHGRLLEPVQPERDLCLAELEDVPELDEILCAIATDVSRGWRP